MPWYRWVLAILLVIYILNKLDTTEQALLRKQPTRVLVGHGLLLAAGVAILFLVILAH